MNYPRFADITDKHMINSIDAQPKNTHEPTCYQSVHGSSTYDSAT